MIVFDHNTELYWANRYKQLHAALGKTNGAYTYSQEIVKYQVPVLERLLKDKHAFVFTVGHSFDYKLSGQPLVINYLHEAFSREKDRIERSITRNKTRHIWITGRYKDSLLIKRQYGTCIFLPMSIDADYIRSFATDQPRFTNRIIFFGNRYFNKRATESWIRTFFHKLNIKVDSISNNLYEPEGEKPILLKREAVLRVLSHYKYGIGSEKCALEMYALGLKVLLSGEKFCGIITNDEEFKKHTKTNFCVTPAEGVVTFSPDIKTCWENIDNSLTKTVDSKDVLPILEEELKKYI